MTRLPVATRDQVSEQFREAFEQVTAESGGVMASGPGSITISSPEMVHRRNRLTKLPKAREHISKENPGTAHRDATRSAWAATPAQVNTRGEDFPHVHGRGRDHRSYHRAWLVRPLRGIPLPRRVVFPHVRARLDTVDGRPHSNPSDFLARLVSG